MFAACEKNDVEGLKRLINSGEITNLEQKNENGSTGFIVACQSGNLNMVRFNKWDSKVAEVTQRPSYQLQL